MPKVIQTVCEIWPEEQVLVRNQYLRNHIKASALLSEARRRARDIVANAEAQASHIFAQAKTEAYIAGILQAVEEIADYLAHHADLTTQLQKNLQERVRALLHDCVSNPDVIIATFEECLGEEELAANTSIELLLPEILRPNYRSLMARLRAHFNGQVNIEYHPGTRFLLRVGDHLAEFAPDDFVELATRRILTDLPAIYAQGQAIAETCRQRLFELFQPNTESE